MARKTDWHRRAALQIAAQLPENPDAALRILELTKDLVKNWVAKPRSTAALVVLFPEPPDAA